MSAYTLLQLVEVLAFSIVLLFGVLVRSPSIAILGGGFLIGKAVLNILDRYRPDLVPAVPAMLAALNKEMRDKPRDLSYIRAVITGASAIDKRVRAEFEAHGPQHVVEGYGLSEASPVTHVNPIDERNRPAHCRDTRDSSRPRAGDPCPIERKQAHPSPRDKHPCPEFDPRSLRSSRIAHL